jgi:hypothetical protein
MLYSEFGLIIILAGLSYFVLPPQLAIWGYYTALCMGLFWFGSTSLTRYKPLPLVPRYILPALPGFYILAAYLVSRLTVLSDRSSIVIRTIPVTLVVAVAAIGFWAKVHSWWQTDLPEPGALRIVKSDVLAHPHKSYLLISSDMRSSQSLAFYFGYQYPKNMDVISAADLAASRLSADKYFIFVDEDRSRFLEKHYDQINYDTAIQSLDFQRVYRSRNIALYATESTGEITELLARVAKSNRTASDHGRD